MTKQFDVIIIGGGATGAGVARDCPCAVSVRCCSNEATSPRVRRAVITVCCTAAHAMP